jgi:endo-1,4-beta-xylanase
MKIASVAVLLMAGALQAYAQRPTVNSTTPVPFIGQPSAFQTLRQAAATKGIPFGSAVSASEFLPGVPDPLVSDPTYVSLLSTQFSQVQPGNAQKNQVIATGLGTYNFAPADEIVAFAQAHNQVVWGHTLLGFANLYQSSWTQSYAATATSTQMATLLQTYITAVATHYAGKVWGWDVVNEALSDTQGSSGFNCKAESTDSEEGPFIWNESPGTGLSCLQLVDDAFVWAHAADPSSLKFYNEYGAEMPGAKFNALVSLLTQELALGAPIDGVGFQFHTDPVNYPLTYAGVLQNMQAIAALGLKIRVSEADFYIPVTGGVATAANLALQQTAASIVAAACVQTPQCISMQVWGVDNNYGGGSGAAGTGLPLLFTGTGVPTPIGTVIVGGLASRVAQYPPSTLGVVPHVDLSNGSQMNDAGGAFHFTAGSGTNGNIVFDPYAGGAIYFNFDTGSGGQNFCNGGTVCNITFDGAGDILTNGMITAPTLRSTTGQRYVCVGTSGQLVSSATACSGT